MSSMFGTNGVRGRVNETMTSAFAFRLGKSVGKVMGSPVAVAADTRPSADMLKSALMAGLMAVGSDVLDLGTVPTPVLQLYIRNHDGVGGGVMVTASNSPQEINGFKCISSDGVESSRMEESSIEEAFSHDIPEAGWASCGEVRIVEDAEDEYVDAVVSHVDAVAIRAAGLRACIDCGNGAASRVVPMVLRRLGVACVEIGCDMEGPLSTGGPSDALCAIVKATGSDIGACFDSDGDSCLFVDQGGVPLSGDDALAIMAPHRLSGPGRVFTPVSSSSVVDDVVEAAGGVVVHTTVCSAVMARRMAESGAVLGGERSGGMIFPEHQCCRDGAMELAAMLELIAKEGPFSDQIRKLPVYYSVKADVPCPDDRKSDVLLSLRDRTVDLDVDMTDGLKIRFDDGWVLLRPSGTEPSFRVSSESKDESVAVSRADEYKALVESVMRDRFRS